MKQQQKNDIHRRRSMNTKNLIILSKSYFKFSKYPGNDINIRIY